MFRKFLLVSFGLIFLFSLILIKNNRQTSAVATLPSGFVDTTFAVGFGGRLSAMEFAPDGRLFVSEKAGALRVVKNGQLLTTPFLTVPVDTDIERGLMGIAFDPNYGANRYVYIYYTYSSTLKNRLSRFTADLSNPDVALAGSEVVLLDNIPSDTGYHNAGAIHFGPDGKLYLSVGDSGISSNAQNLGTIPGKILRLNSDGTIPSDNPFVGQAGARGEIWAYGLRNPFTFAFQPGSGRMFINDVGNDTWEELNEGQEGANYGWPTCEGVCANPSFVNPIYAYNHNGASASITGAVFYNGGNFPSEYSNDYFFGDYSQHFIKRYDMETGQVIDFATNALYPVDLRVGPEGALYYLSVEAKEIHRVTYGAPPTPTPLPGSRQITLNPIEDSNVVSTAPSINYGLSSKIYIISSNPTDIGYLKFDLSQISGKVIDSISLKIKTVNDPYSGSVATQNFNLVNDNSWGELTVTYDNRPAMSGVLGSLANLNPNTIYTIPLDESALQQKAGGILSIGVDATGTSDVMYFYTKESSIDKPQLIVNYSDPVTPTPTPEGQSPLPSILTPPEGTTYRAGDDVNFSGSATDPEDGNLAPSALTWEVLFHHGTHTHPFYGPVSGITSGSIHLSDTGETSADTWYRIHLRATDSNGNMTEVTRDITPLKSNITLQTQPTGLTLNIDGQPKTTPYTTQGVVNFKRELSAPSTQTLNGKTYNFSSWSDGGAQTHIISTPETDTAYTATYNEVVSPNLILNPGFENTGTNWLSPWLFQLRSPASATIAKDTSVKVAGAASARINITRASTDWYVQVIQGGFSLAANRTHTLTFWARASSNRNIRIAVQQNYSPYGMYFQKTQTITTAWQKYTITFTPTVSEANAVLAFNIGANTGQIWLDDISLTR